MTDEQLSIPKHIVHFLILSDHQLYAEVDEQIGIAVDTSGSGDGALTSHTVGPHDKPIPTEVEFDDEQGTLRPTRFFVFPSIYF